mgnify:CR=1 FL=1
MLIEMEEEIIKPEKTESPKSTDRVSQTETINSLEQNKNHTQALESNPDQFPSIANLRIPNADQIEPFQIVDDGKTLAASRKVEPVMDSFNNGLQALPGDATEGERAQYQIDYIMKKSGESGLLLKTGISEDQAATKPPNHYDQIIKALDGYAHELKERNIGSLIGTVEGVGNVAVSLAAVADFGAALVLGDKQRAGEMGAQFGQSVGTAIASGIKLFSAANQYLFNVGFEGDYSKPFKDIACVGAALNHQWSELPPREQERLKAKLVTELLADGLIGLPGAKAIQKAGNYTEMFELVAKNAGHASSSDTLKTANTIAKSIEDLGTGALKITNVPKDALRPEMFMLSVPENLRTALRLSDDALLDAIRARNLQVVVAKEGTDDMKSLIKAGAEGSYAADVIILRPGAPRIAAIEEYVHALQDRFPSLAKLSIADREVHVKEFILRHHKMFGLDQNDRQALQLLLEDARQVADR